MSESRSRIVYFGTPAVAVAPLRALHAAGHKVVLVVTRPPRRRGRGGPPTPSAVAAAAVELGLRATCEPAEAAAVEADAGVVVAYGELISDEVLRARRTVNLHFSMLPRWRGAAPVERAILAGDPETGVCLMDVDSELDAGAVYRRASTPICPHETADEVRARLCGLGIEILLEALADGFAAPQPQSGTVTWAHKLAQSELRIDWSGPAAQVMRQVRVGGAWTTFRGRRLKVLEALPHTRPTSTPTAGSPVAVPDVVSPVVVPGGPADAGCLRPSASPGVVSSGAGFVPGVGVGGEGVSGFGIVSPVVVPDVVSPVVVPDVVSPVVVPGGPADAGCLRPSASPGVVSPGAGFVPGVGVDGVGVSGSGVVSPGVGAGGPAVAVPGAVVVESGLGGLSAVLVWAADACVELVTVQAAGRRAMSAREWHKGARPAPGERLDG